MSKTPKTTQEEPTRPRPTDAAGRQLDEHNLPLSGPARIAALAGKADPALAEAGAENTPPAAAGAQQEG